MGGTLAAVALAGGGSGAYLHARLRASLPLVEGERALAGLGAPVRIERDARGVPVVRGRSRLDVARATGFLHAQERFFQMDLLRRSAAGELAALFGRAALELDREVRPLRLRLVAHRAIQELRADERDLLAAYAQGVNAGLGALGAAPFEYLALRSAPAAVARRGLVAVRARDVPRPAGAPGVAGFRARPDARDAATRARRLPRPRSAPSGTPRSRASRSRCRRCRGRTWST